MNGLLACIIAQKKIEIARHKEVNFATGHSATCPERMLRSPSVRTVCRPLGEYQAKQSCPEAGD